MEYTHPFMLVDGDKEAMEFSRIPGSYAANLIGNDVYLEGDLVELNAGTVRKCTAATTAAVGQLFLAGADYVQPFAFDYYKDAGVPLNVIPRRNRFVFTYRGNTAAGAGPLPANHTFASGDKQAVQARGRVGIVFDPHAKCLVAVTESTAANQRGTLVGIFKGDVGDDNVQVIVQLDAGGSGN